MKKTSKSFENCKIWVMMLSVFLLSSILGSQAKAGWVDSNGNVYCTTGNVGIGTPIPMAKLDLGTDYGATNKKLALYGDLNSFYGFGIDAGQMTFWAGNTKYMVLTSNGKVGIGTTNPGGAKLAVEDPTNPVLIRLGGTATGRTTLDISLSAVDGGYSQLQSVKSQGSALGDLALNPGGGNVGIGTVIPKAKLSVMETISGLTTGLQIGSYHTPGVVAGAIINAFDDNGTTVRPLVLQNNGGRVGIGTTNPQSELAVKGTITAKEVVVTNTGWSDFVFNDDYNLMKLDELEKNIKKHKHLPEIPSAKEVSENGVSVGEMQAKLLQKVEELTLYVIEQNKEISILKKELAAVK